MEKYIHNLRYRKVYILADNDDKGAGLNFAKTVKADIYGAKIILMPDGYDVNRYVTDVGIDSLKGKIDGTK